MSLDDQIKSAQLEKLKQETEKLKRELASMPKPSAGMGWVSKLELLSKLSIPVFALLAAGFAFTIGLPKAQIDLMKARDEIAALEKKREEFKKEKAAAEASAQAALKKFNEYESKQREIEKRLAEIKESDLNASASARVDQLIRSAQSGNESLQTAQAQLKAAINIKKYVYGGYKVDVFYCTDSPPDNRRQAEAMVAMSEGKTTGKWSLRTLTPEQNERDGYGIKRHLIRFNSDERLVAETIKGDFQKAQNVEIASQQINYPTPNYLSVFFCGG